MLLLTLMILHSGLRREQFRPLAPSVLAEHAADWFEQLDWNASPYMSITAMMRAEKRDLVPAIVHVDGSARLQTVTKEEVRPTPCCLEANDGEGGDNGGAFGVEDVPGIQNWKCIHRCLDTMRSSSPFSLLVECRC